MMLEALSWSNVLRGYVCGTSPSILERFMNGVRLDCWYFMKLVCLMMYSLNSIYVICGWMLCWSCGVMWIRALCHLILFLVDQVLVLDYWCTNPICINE